jgi:hypothetical protein
MHGQDCKILPYIGLGFINKRLCHHIPSSDCRYIPFKAYAHKPGIDGIQATFTSGARECIGRQVRRHSITRAEGGPVLKTGCSKGEPGGSGKHNEASSVACVKTSSQDGV